jgi:hypothetical protein
MGSASDAMLKLRPVSFPCKAEIDPKHTAQFGLVAEEVEKISPDLVTHDAKGHGCPWKSRLAPMTRLAAVGRRSAEA